MTTRFGSDHIWEDWDTEDKFRCVVHMEVGPSWAGLSPTTWEQAKHDANELKDSPNVKSVEIVEIHIVL